MQNLDNSGFRSCFFGLLLKSHVLEHREDNTRTNIVIDICQIITINRLCFDFKKYTPKFGEAHFFGHPVN